MVVNKKLNLQWKTKTGTYQNGSNLYLNRILVGYCDWNAGRSRDSKELNRYVGVVILPSLKNDRFYGDEQEEVKAKIERIVGNWFNEALK